MTSFEFINLFSYTTFVDWLIHNVTVKKGYVAFARMFMKYVWVLQQLYWEMLKQSAFYLL